MIETDDLNESLAQVEQLQGVGLVQWSVTSADDDAVTVALAGELDLSGAETVNQLLRRVVAAGPATLNVDLAHLSFLDSSGIQCLVDAAKQASSVGCTVVVRRPSEMIVRVLQICGVDTLLLEGSDGEATAAPSEA